jgi:hypothetical protein
LSFLRNFGGEISNNDGTEVLMLETLNEPLVRRIDIIMPGRLGFQLLLAVQFAQCVRKFHSAIKV